MRFRRLNFALLLLLFTPEVNAIFAQGGVPPFQQTISVSDGVMSHAVTFGKSGDASSGYDRNVDQPAPPLPPSPAFDARFINAGDPAFSSYYIDMRGLNTTDTFQLWMTPENEDRQNIELSWQAIDGYPAGSIMLTHPEGQVDLTSAGTLTLNDVDPGGLTLDIEYSIAVNTEDPTVYTPNAFALYPTYPNPVSGSSVLAFDVPGAQYVSIVLSDIQGRTIKTLVSGQYDAGRFSVRWTPGDLADGLYFYTMRTETFTQTNKVVVIR